MQKTFHTNSAEETEALAERIGRQLRGGEVIEFISDLGGGKTTFTRGLARGLGSKDLVASPTFTISKLYEGGGLQLAHFDFYRLAEPGLIEHELQDYLSDNQSVTVVEWGAVVAHVLPKERLTIRLDRISDTRRRLVFEYTDTTKHLMETL